MKRQWVATIQPEHVGTATIRTDACSECGHRRTVSLQSAIGRVQEHDVGKRVYLINGVVVQVENDEQMARRTQVEGDG